MPLTTLYTIWPPPWLLIMPSIPCVKLLPLHDTKDVRASISGRLPANLERPIARAPTGYEHNITSVIT